MSTENISEQAVVYAALILQDDGVEITAEKLLALTKGAGVEVEPVWANIFAKALQGRNIGDMLMNVGAGGAAPAAAADSGAAGAAADAPKEEEKEEEKEESDEDMGFGLFD